MKSGTFIILLSFFTVIALGQNSTELESKKGFKEIKLLNDISTVKAIEVKKGVDASRYEYVGDSKSLYNINTENIYIETDGASLIRKIQIHMPAIEPKTFFAFLDEIKKDFSTPCFYYSDKSSGNGTMAWKTDKFYMEYIWEYQASGASGKWKSVVIIGLFTDLPKDTREMYENSKDGF